MRNLILADDTRSLVAATKTFVDDDDDGDAISFSCIPQSSGAAVRSALVPTRPAGEDRRRRGVLELAAGPIDGVPQRRSQSVATTRVMRHGTRRRL